MIKKLLGLLFLFILCAGCSTQPEIEKFSSQLFAMDTVMDLSVYASDGAVLDEAAQLVTHLDRSLSVTNPDSEIGQLNTQGTARLSENTRVLLEKALGYCESTNGTLDLSIYPVVKAWGFTTDQHRIPEERELESLLSHVDWQQIQLSGDTVSLPQGMEIDLGSVAKGYTGDLLIQLFRDQRITSALLNLGGDVQALGSKPDGSPWKVGVRDPLGTDYMGVLEVTDQAVITSGGYERYFEGPDGTVYWHILDPSTGKPARSGLISATIVGAEGAYCDALSTSLFIMGQKRATAFWEAHRDFQMILVTEDRKVLITPGLQESFRLTDGAPYTLQVIGHD